MPENQMINQPTYAARLSALSQAVEDAQDAAAGFVMHGDARTFEEAGEVAYVNLWDALLNALITHADCDHAELLAVVAGTLQMRAPMPVVTVGPVPIWGVVEDGRVNWNSHRNGGD